MTAPDTRCRHRYWMPCVTRTFIGLFFFALVLSIYKACFPDDAAISDKAILINEAVSPRITNGERDFTNGATMFETIRVGGFAEGADGFNCTVPANAALIERINSAIRRVQTKESQPVLFLVGSADRTALSSPLRAQFGSNTGLARARVTAVEHCLTLTGGPDGSRQPVVMRLVTGPSYTPKVIGTKHPSNTSQAQEQDREVQAFVVGVQAIRHSGDD